MSAVIADIDAQISEKHKEYDAAFAEYASAMDELRNIDSRIDARRGLAVFRIELFVLDAHYVKLLGLAIIFGLTLLRVESELVVMLKHHEINLYINRYETASARKDALSAVIAITLSSSVLRLYSA